MTKTTKYIVGQTYSVALNTILLPDVKLTARFALGNNFLSVKADIERQGQLVPCFANLLSEDELKAHSGKLFKLLEGAMGRYKVAELLNRELLIQIVEPRTDAGILELAISTNGPRSAMSAMDISVAATRQEALGFSEDRACQNLSWVAGKGKPLGKQRYWQYKRLQGLPVEIQHMAHLGAEFGGIKLDAALHMTNRKLTQDQYAAIVAGVKDTRKRLIHEEWERDQKYIEREKDAVLKASMGEALPKEPEYTPRKRAKAEGEAITTQEVTDTMQELGISPKPDSRPDPNPPATTATQAAMLSHAEIFAATAKLREIGGVAQEAADAIDALITKKISDEDFCKAMRALVENGSPTAKRNRREVRQKEGKAPVLVAG